MSAPNRPKLPTVADLVALLQTMPQDMPLAIRMFSEQCVLELDEITVVPLCEPRPDGWIENRRPDKPTRDWLLFPGH